MFMFFVKVLKAYGIAIVRKSIALSKGYTNVYEVDQELRGGEFSLSTCPGGGE